MKDKPGTMLSVAVAGLLLLGDLGLFFSQTRFVGYLLFAIGCVLGVVNIARSSQGLDNDEKFHFLAALVGLLMIGIFVFTSTMLVVVTLALILFAIDFLLALLDLRNVYAQEDEDEYFDEYAKPSIKEPIKEVKVARKEKDYVDSFNKEKSESERKFEALQKKKVYEDLDEIKSQFENITVIEDGYTDDAYLRKQAEQIKKDFKSATFVDSEKKVDDAKKKKAYNDLESIKKQLESVKIVEDGRSEDKVLRKQAEQIKKEIKRAVVVEDPKAGRYFYKEEGKTFHVAGCMALGKINKKEIKSSQSRTEVLARGYKPCKVCSS